jgi:hypothetical protein
MILEIELNPLVERRLQAEATKAGVTATEYATELLMQSLPKGPIDPEEQKRLNAPSIALIDEWLERVKRPRTTEEEAEAEADMLELMRNLNAPRRESGERLHFPDVE